jgi:hypothetical protein
MITSKAINACSDEYINFFCCNMQESFLHVQLVGTSACNNYFASQVHSSSQETVLKPAIRSIYLSTRDHAGLVVTLQSCVRDALGSNFGNYTGYRG